MVKKSLAETRPYAMAFVDVRMPPGWDGIETIARDLASGSRTADRRLHRLRRLFMGGDARESRPTRQPARAEKALRQYRSATTCPCADQKMVLNHPGAPADAGTGQSESSRWHRLRSASQKLSMKVRCPAAIQSFPDQRFVDVNERFALELSVASRAELIGHTPADLFLWDKPEIAGPVVRAVSRKESRCAIRRRKCATQSGELREMRVSLSPLSLRRSASCAAGGGGCL